MTEVVAAPREVFDDSELARVLESPASPGEIASDRAGVPAVNGVISADVAEEVEPPPPAADDPPASVRSRIRARAAGARRTLSRNRSPMATWAGGALCALTLFCLLFVGYLAGFSRVEMSRAQTHLIAALNGTGGFALLSAVVPAEGEPAGVITIPALGLNDVVIAGTSAEDLEQGPGYLLGSAPPGTRGNTVIAGKRASFGGPFSNLGALRAGDPITLVSSLGTFTYKVEQAGSALPGWRDPAGPVDRAQLTLVTADSSVLPNGLEYVGAGLVGKPVAYVSSRAIVPPSGSLGLTGDGGLIMPTVLWFLLLAGVAVGTVLAMRRCRKRIVVYILATPLLLALCMVVFHDLSGLLPATL